MKFKLRIAGAALLASVMAPAWALQLGQIQVKSALNQPLVAAIPLHPENLSELDGLTVQLASPTDFARAGLQMTATDRTLRFHVAGDNNGQKLILVTSSQPVSDPYLDFLIEVNTRQGKQVREFVVLLNPVIAAPAPAVQTAPVATAPVAAPPPPAAQPAELPAPPAEVPQAAPPPQAHPQAPPPPRPAAQAQPERRAPAQAAAKPRAPAPPPPPPAAASPARQTIPVQRGDTLYGIAKDAAPDTGATVNQMMMALKSANPEAFFKDNINDLKAGAILRIPTREEIGQTNIAEANAEVHRQYQTWRATRPHPATMVEGTAANAAARTAPEPTPLAPESDHLALVPPNGAASGAGSRPGVAGGTGTETVAGLQQRLQNDRGTLTSLEQSNTDLESRVHSLEDIAGKSDKLLSLKGATLAELQRKLTAVQSGQPLTAAASAPVAAAGAKANPPGASTNAAARPAGKATSGKPAASSTIPWFERPLAWIVAALIVLGLLLIGLLGRRRHGREAPAVERGPLTDPEDLSPHTSTAAYQASLQTQLAEDPFDLGAHLALCRLYHAEGDVERFVAAAEAMHAHVREPGSLEWHEVAVMGEELAPGDPLFAAPAEARPATESSDAPTGAVPAQEFVDSEAAVAATSAASEDPILPESAEPESRPAAPDDMLPVARAVQEAAPERVHEETGVPDFRDDPVDTKLDLARAYLDMGDPVGARAMLDEVLEEGSQVQQDEARRLLAETTE